MPNETGKKPTTPAAKARSKARTAIELTAVEMAPTHTPEQFVHLWAQLIRKGEEIRRAEAAADDCLAD